MLPITPEIGALKSMHALLEYLSEAGTIGLKSTFVLNNLFAREILKLRDVESFLGSKMAVELPYDPFLYLKAVNEGVPIVTGRPALDRGRTAGQAQLDRVRRGRLPGPGLGRGQEVGRPVPASSLNLGPANPGGCVVTSPSWQPGCQPSRVHVRPISVRQHRYAPLWSRRLVCRGFSGTEDGARERNPVEPGRTPVREANPRGFRVSAGRPAQRTRRPRTACDPFSGTCRPAGDPVADLDRVVQPGGVVPVDPVSGGDRPRPRRSGDAVRTRSSLPSRSSSCLSPCSSGWRPSCGSTRATARTSSGSPA